MNNKLILPLLIFTAATIYSCKFMEELCMKTSGFHSKYINTELSFSIETPDPDWGMTTAYNPKGVIITILSGKTFNGIRPVVNVAVEKMKIKIKDTEEYGQKSAELLKKAGFKIMHEGMSSFADGTKAWKIIYIAPNGQESRQLLVYKKPYGYVVNATADAKGWEEKGETLKKIMLSFHLF